MMIMLNRNYIIVKICAVNIEDLGITAKNNKKMIMLGSWQGAHDVS